MVIIPHLPRTTPRLARCYSFETQHEPDVFAHHPFTTSSLAQQTRQRQLEQTHSCKQTFNGVYRTLPLSLSVKIEVTLTYHLTAHQYSHGSASSGIWGVLPRVVFVTSSNERSMLELQKSDGSVAPERLS